MQLKDKKPQETYSTSLNSFQHKREIMLKYNITSTSYDELYGEEQQRKYGFVLNKISCIKGLILDAGCGTGLLFMFLSKKYYELRSKLEYVGVDISIDMLRRAKIRIRNDPFANLIQADLDYLPFRNNIFNFIFAFTVLQNIPYPKKTYTEFLRLAKCLIIMTFPKNIEINAFRNKDVITSATIKDNVIIEIVDRD